MVGYSSSEEKQRRYYDKISKIYDQHYFSAHALRYRHDLYADILEGIDLKQFRVLDAMCGGGENTAFMIERSAAVEGIDISQEQCHIYAKRFPTCRVTNASIFETGFDDESFDLVVTDSLHHLHPHLDRGLEEILRIIRPYGYFLLWEPSAKSLLDMFRKVWYKLDRKYFQGNEKAVDLSGILKKYDGHLKPVKKKYGGNVAYLLLNESMILRISPNLLDRYAKALLAMEDFISKLQTRFLSCWVLALLQKIPGKS